MTKNLMTAGFVLLTLNGQPAFAQSLVPGRIAGTPVNFVIPELVSEEGAYVSFLDHPFQQFSAGADGYRRTVSAVSPRIGRGHLLAALETQRGGAPRANTEKYGKLNGALRYSKGDSRQGVSITATGYYARWISPGPVPQVGKTRRYTVSAEMQRSGSSNATKVGAHAMHLLNSPVNGPQFGQVDVSQSSIGLYYEGALALTDNFRATGGLRGDVYRSGTDTVGLLSPKLGFAFAASRTLELYAGYDRGFHGNDGRGVTLPVDPLPLVGTRGGEIGLRTVLAPRLHSAVALWEQSRRLGIEWTNSFSPRPWLTFNAELSWLSARSSDGDATVTSGQSFLVNVEAGYRVAPRTRLVLEALNLFDARDADDFYRTGLSGEGVNGARTVRFGVQLGL